MGESKFNRWRPGYMRGPWGHLFWILPVLSLLWVLLDHKDRLMAKEARATFVVRNPPLPKLGADVPVDSIEPGRKYPSVSYVSASQIFALFSSPELLAAAATELGLTKRWGVDANEAAARLGSHVTCETQRYTRLVHLTVTSAPGLDELEACEAIFNQGTKPGAFQSILGIEGGLFMKMQEPGLLDRTHVTSGAARIEIRAEPHRLPIDRAARIRSLRIDATCALFYSVILAFLLTCLLERWFPRRSPSTKECLPV